MAEPFPPPNYIVAPSAVEGIEVYMPAPPSAEAHQEIVDFKCPQCGALTAYSIADGGLTCAHCGYYEPPRREAVGKGAEEFEFKVETLERAAHGWGRERKELHCQHCGAATSLSPEMLTLTCPFCGSNKVIQREAPQDVLRPRFLVPFKLNAEECGPIVHAWLRTGWMTLGSLRRLARFGDFSAIYLPFWTFDATARADWKAEVPHTTTRHYWSGFKRRTRTVTEWKWEQGHVDLPIDDLLIDGSTRLSPILLEQIRQYDLKALVPYEPEYLAGLQAQAYEVSLEAAWEAGRKSMREMVRQICCGQAAIPRTMRNQRPTSQPVSQDEVRRIVRSCMGFRIRNLSMLVDFDQETWRYILLPVYITTYRLGNRVYQVLINGQTGALAGQRPVSWLKVGLASVGAMLPGLILSIAGAFVLITEELGVFLVFSGIGLLILGFGLAVKWVQDAMRMDDA